MKKFGNSNFLFDSASGFSSYAHDEHLPVELQIFSSGWDKSIAYSPGWLDSRRNSVVLLKSSFLEPLKENFVIALPRDKNKQPHGDLTEKLLG
jgi:hypothetical protein